MSQIKPQKPVTQRQQPFDDRDYRKYLHGLPCRACGATTGCQAAHLGHARGMGYKEAVDYCVPLCPDCHRDFDTAPEGKAAWYHNRINIPEARRAYAAWKASPNETGKD